MHATLKPFLSALLMCVVIACINVLVHSHVFALILSAALGGATYVLALTFIFHIDIIKEVKVFSHNQ
jgi:uncharacterized membrane protein